MNLVTGATGLVGTAICLELLKAGRPVRALVRVGSDTSWLQKVFAFREAASLFEQIEWAEGDLLDLDSLDRAMEGCTHVFHTAAVVSFNPKDEGLMLKMNATGTENVVNAALAKGIHKICHISSTAALGRVKPGQHINEDSAWEQSKLNTPYAISKYAAEREVWRANEEGLPCVILNPSIILGPGNPERSSSAMLTRIAQGINYYPGGSNGFVGLQDVARAALHLTFSEISGERFVVNAENLTYRQVFEWMAASLGVKPATKPASKTMLHIARFFESLRQLFTGKRATLTRASVRNACNTVFYSSEKLLATGFAFTPVTDSIASAADFYASNKPS